MEFQKSWNKKFRVVCVLEKNKVITIITFFSLKLKINTTSFVALWCVRRTLYAQFVKRSSPKILQLFVIWSLGFHFRLRRIQSRAHKRYRWWERFLFARRAVQKKGNYCLRNSADVLISTSQTFWYFNNDYLGYNRAETKIKIFFLLYC